MQRRSVWARILLIPAWAAAVMGPSPAAFGHGSGALPADPQPSAELRAAGAGNSAGFINFETPHVHPIDISPNGQWLAACNTPDGRIEIYSVHGTTGALTLSASVTVGVDPVSVRFRTND